MKNNYFGLIVDTDSYTGNFYREFCAYTTGCADGPEEDGIDKNEDYSIFDDEDHMIIERPSEYGSKPVNIYQNKDTSKFNGYNSLIIYFENCPSDEQIKFIKNKSKTFNEFYRENCRMGKSHKDIKIIGYHVEEFITSSKKSKV